MSGHPGICTSDPQPRKYPENEHHLAKDKQKTRTQSDTELIRGAKGSGLSKMVNNEHKSIPRSENESVDYKFQSQWWDS